MVHICRATYKRMAKQVKKKKKTRRWGWLTIILLLGAAALSFYFWNKYFTIQEAKFVRYPAFGIDIPENYQLHGIDVSRFQSFIDWPSVKQMKVKKVQIDFAFIKATEGLGNVDRQFRRNWKKAREANVPRGAYHFFLATKSGKAQAQNFISTVTLIPGDLPPVLDVEQLYGVTPEKMRKEVIDWLNMVEDHYDVKPIIYTYVNFYNHHMGDAFNDYPLWVAHYLEKDKPRIDRPWIFWQHNERGRVNGITHTVDFNVFNGDTTAFKKLLIK